MGDMYVDESLTETQEIVWECDNCDLTAGETFEECPRCEQEQ